MTDSLKVALLLGTMVLPMMASSSSSDSSDFSDCPSTYGVLCDSNGLKIQPQGNRIRLIENVIIEGNCHLFEGRLKKLEIKELCPFEVRVTSGSVLDLSGGTLKLGGNIVFVLEPGAEIYFGEPGSTGTLRLGDNVKAGLAPDGNRLDLSQFTQAGSSDSSDSH